MSAQTDDTAPAAAPALASDFLRILQERGFIHQCSDLSGLDAALKGDRITAYIGFDCTAASLHVGSLVQIMMLHWLQASGHRPIVLMGGGTTRIGDPTGRDEGRKVLSAADIETNKAGIAQVFAKFLTFGDDAALMVDTSRSTG
jgi:tyrosyl-tRNA synthetase